MGARRSVLPRRTSLTLLAVAVLQLSPSPAVARPKVDTVVLDNGDTITCEIRQLERGLLNLKTDYTKGTVQVEWIHVDRIVSEQLFEVEVADGTRYFGAIAWSAEVGSMAVIGGNVIDAVDRDDIVRIAQIDERFRDRLKGSIDMGLTAKQANDEVQSNMSTEATYRTRKYFFEASASTYLTARSDADATQRADVAASLRRTLPGKWFWSASVLLQHNEELNLDLRETLTSGVGRFIVQSSRTLLSWDAGLGANQERYSTEDKPTENLEATLHLNYQYFLFGRRETDFALGLTALPNLTTWGRVRSNLSARLTHEFVKDLYFRLSLVFDYDSQPPGGQKTDWNFTTSLGYTF